MRVGQNPNETPGFAPGGDGTVGETSNRFRHEVLAVVFQVRGRRLRALLWQRARAPFAGSWALPGGLVGDHERLGSSLGRHMAAKVDLTDVAYLEQLETRSDVDRDPRERTIATAYVALVSANLNPSIPADTAWCHVDELPPTAFDHASIINSGRERLRAKLTYTNVGYALAPETFTIAELRDVYVACLGHAISATNLQRVLLRRKIIKATNDAAPPPSSGGRPATLYRFAERTLLVTDPFAVFRPPRSLDQERST
ncbi:MAG TPA: NUDIX domain-containing protein [Acidimicrobiales bacterium]|nr:NUDIX domain-containing protein [Acidimicrobiales bacterium]